MGAEWVTTRLEARVAPAKELQDELGLLVTLVLEKTGYMLAEMGPSGPLWTLTLSGNGRWWEVKRHWNGESWLPKSGAVLGKPDVDRAVAALLSPPPKVEKTPAAEPEPHGDWICPQCNTTNDDGTWSCIECTWAR